MNDYPPKLLELIDDFKLISNKNERMDMLIYYAEKFVEVSENIIPRPLPEENRVPACESGAFVFSDLDDTGNMQYYFAVENPQGISAKAMAAILSETLNGIKPEVVAKLPIEVVYDFFGKELSMGRDAGLTSMVGVVRSHAMKFLELK